MKRQNLMRLTGIVGLVALFATPQAANAETRRLTLDEAVHLALTQNRALKIARLKTEENQQKKAVDRSAYFPKFTNDSNLAHITELQNVIVPAGSFGSAAGTPVPSHEIGLPQGALTFFSSGTMLAQPLTQLLRIHQQNRIASAEVAISRDDVKKAETEVSVQVHALYYGILVAQLQKKAADQQTQYADETLRESEEDVRNGSALKVAAIGSQAELLDSKQSVLTAEFQLADLKTELNDLLGLPLNTELELNPAVPTSFNTLSKMEYTRIAWSENPEILAAEETVRKARAAVAAARTAYIPDITAFARYSYQNNVPFLVHNFGTFGVSLHYDIFDFGKRRAEVREHADELAAAELNLERLKDEVAVSIERSYNKVERTKAMVDVAQQVMTLRDEGDRLASNQLTYGVIQISDRRQASSARYKAQAGLLQASLGYLLAHAELEQAIGRTPGF